MKPPLNKGPQQNAASCGFDPSQIRNRMERRLQQLDLSPSLAKAGESWSELEDSDSDLEPIMAHHLDSPVSDANSSSQQSATNNGGVMASTTNNNNNNRSKTLCTRLPIQDIDQFGLYPKNDRFITVICVVCSQVIKACAFAKHMESRHFHVLQRLKRRKTNANKFVTSISNIVGNGCDDLLKLNSEEETSSSISNKSSSVNSSIQAASSSSDLHQLNGKSSISLSSSSSSPIIFDQSSCDFLPSIGTSDGPGSTNNSWDHQPQQSQLPLEGVCNSMAANATNSLRNTTTNNLNLTMGDKLNNNNSTNSSYLNQQLPMSPNQVDGVGGAGGVPVSDTGIAFSSNGNCIAPSFRVIKGNYGGNKLSCANKVLPVPTVSKPTVTSNTTGALTSASNSLLPMGGSLIDSKRTNPDSMELYDSDNSEAIVINSGFTDDEDDEVEESLDNLSKIRMSTDNKYLGFRSNISTNEDIRSNSGFFNNEDPSNYLEIHKQKELGATNSSHQTDPSTKTPSAISRKTINRMKVVPGNAVASTTTTTTTASVTSSATPAVTTAKKSVCSKMVAIISKNPNATPIIVHSGTMLQSQSQLTTPNTPTITTPNLANQVPTPTSSTSSSISTPTVAVSSSSVSTPAASSIPKKKLVLCKDRLYDPDQHCGVFQTGMDRPCTRTLTCRSHIVSLRRAVAGRSKPFDELLTEYKRVRGFKDRQPGSRRKTPSLSDTKNTPTTTPQQTPTATKAAAAAKSQQSMSSNEKSLLVDDEVILFQEFIRQSPVGAQDSSGTINQAPKRSNNKSQTSKNSDDLQSEEDVLFTFNMYDDKSGSHHHNSQQSSSHFHHHPHQNHHHHQIATTSRAYPRPASTSTVELNNFEHLFITNLSETTTTTSNHHNRSNCKNPLIEDLEDRSDDLMEGYSNSLEFPDVLSNIPSLDSVDGKTVDESPSNQFHIRYQLPSTVAAKAKQQRARPAPPPQQSQEPQQQQQQQHGQQHDNNSLLSNNNYNTKLINTNQLLPVGNSMYTIVPHNDSLPKKAIAEVPSSQPTSSSAFSSLLLANYTEPVNQSSSNTSTSQVYHQQRPTVNNNTSQNYDTFSSNPNSLLLQDSTTSTISIQEKPERNQSHQSTSLLLSNNNNNSNNRSVYQHQQNPNNLIYQQSIIDSSDSGSGFGNQSTSSSTGFVNNSILLPDSMLNSLAMLSPSSTVTVSSATATTNSSKTIEPTTLKNLLNLPTASTTSNSGNIALAMGSDFENQIFSTTNSTSGLTGDADSMSSSSMMSPVVIHNSSATVGNSSENWIIENIKTDLMQSVEDKFRSSSAPLPPAPPPPPPPPLANNGCNVTTNVVASGNSYEAAAAAAAADDFDISDPAFSQILLQDTANAAASIVPDDIFDLIEDLEKEEMRFSEISDYITVDHQTANNNNNNSNSLMSISSGKLSPGDMDSLKRKIEQSNFKSYSDYGCAMSDSEADPRTSISQPNLLQMQSHPHDKISINSGSSGLGSILSGGSQLNLTESSNSSSIKSKEFEQKPKFVTILNGSFDSINRDGTTGNASLQILNNVISNSGLRLQRSQRTYLKNSENSSTNDNSNSQQQKTGNILMPITVSGSIVSSGNSPAHQTQQQQQQQQQMQSQISSPNNNKSSAAAPSSAPSTPTSNPYQLQFPMPAFLLPSLSHIRQVPTNVYILQPSDIANSNSGGGSTVTTSDSILSGTVPAAAASSTVVSSGSSLLSSSASSSSANSSGSTHLSSSAGTAASSSSSPASSILRIHPQNIRFIPPPNKKHKSE